MANERAPEEVQTERSKLCVLIAEQDRLKDTVKKSGYQIWVVWV